MRQETTPTFERVETGQPFAPAYDYGPAHRHYSNGLATRLFVSVRRSTQCGWSAGHAGPETAIATTYLIVWIPPAGDSLPCAGGTAADKAGS